MNIIISSATHRMGSTMLQRIFNSRKKTLIWGENGGAMTQFLNINNNALHFSNYSQQERNNYFNQDENPNTWIANMTPETHYCKEAIIKSIKAFHDTLYSQYKEKHNLIGFKEVRYGRGQLELFKEAYPNCKIVMLIREPYGTYNSIQNINPKWYDGVDGFMNVWLKRYKEYTELAKKYGYYLVKYEDICGCDKKTMELICDLAQITEDDYMRVVNKKIGSMNSAGSKSNVKNSIKEQISNRLKEANVI